jgi:hypothetical protein
VIGFALGWEGQAPGRLWITGDTVLYDGLRQVADRLRVDTAPHLHPTPMTAEQELGSGVQRS